MRPDWVSNLGPLTYESGALPTALPGPAPLCESYMAHKYQNHGHGIYTEPSKSVKREQSKS